MKKIISLIIVTVLVALIIFLIYKNSQPESSLSQKINQDTTSDKPSKFRILTVGDSLTAGYGLNLSESYPMQLEQKLKNLGKQVEVVNMGVSGETTAGLLDRTSFILSQNPEMILITIGGNDALRALPPDETKKNITTIVKKFKTVIPGDKIFLANIQAPGNVGIFYKSKFDSMYKDIASSEGVVLVDFVVPEVFLDESLMQGDGIHPNKMGYERIINDHILEKVLKELD